MKKIVAILSLSLFILGNVYPVVYGMENLLEEPKQEEMEIIQTSENTSEELEEVAEESDEEIKELTPPEENQDEIPKEEIVDTKPIQTIDNDINIKNIEYKGEICIDSPTNNTTYTLPDTTIVEITGWAVSNDKGAKVCVSVDGNYVGVERGVRSDVDSKVSPQYGGTVNTPQAGFKASINFTGCAPKSYQLKVEQIASTGAVISSATQTINIQQKSYQGAICIDSPIDNQTYTLPDTTIVEITGWAVSNDKGAKVRVSVDGNYVGVERGVRSDVDSKVSPEYGGIQNTPNAGFKAIIDFTGCAQKSYILKVEQIASTGAVINSATQTINIQHKLYRGAICIDSPTDHITYTIPDSTTVEVTGWAVSDDKKASLRVSVDGNLVGVERGKRSDVDNKVSPEYGGTQNTPNAGFKATIDFTGCAQKSYILKVEQIASTGAVINSATQTINIQHRPYRGAICIDSPINNATLKVPDISLVEVTGWAVSDDKEASLRVSVDGNLVGVERGVRSDVDSKVSPEYGGTQNTPNAGFKATIDFTGCIDKTYLLKVEQLSRFGEVISTMTQSIHIVTPDYPEITCIDMPISTARYSSGVLVVAGWTVTTDKGDYVQIYLDGVPQVGAQRGPRNDVIAVYGAQFGLTSADNPGFYSEIGTGHLGEGIHTLKVVHYSHYHKKIGEAQVRFMISNTLKKGIDVSHHNGDINWDAVRSSGVDFAILKIGEYRESTGAILMDTYFERNYNACKARGIAVGGYFYSYAFDPTEAAHEADACTAIISGKTFEMPIFFDVEDKLITNNFNVKTNKEMLTNASITFCEVMKSRGYQVGIYSSKNFLETYLNMSALEKYSVWVAHYGVDNTTYRGKYDIWQHTSTGSVPGITGSVDLNWCYKRYY